MFLSLSSFISSRLMSLLNILSSVRIMFLCSFSTAFLVILSCGLFRFALVMPVRCVGFIVVFGVSLARGYEIACLCGCVCVLCLFENV